MLSSKNLPLAGTKKFHSQSVGPFTVVALVGPVAVHLALTGKLQGLHPVFHVSLLCKVQAWWGWGRTPTSHYSG